MKKILFITDNFPYPPNKDGNTSNIYNILITLKKEYGIEYEIDLLYIGSKSIDKKDLENIYNFVSSFYYEYIRNRLLLRLSIILNKKNYKYNNYDIFFYCTFISGYYKNLLGKGGKHFLYAADCNTLYYKKTNYCIKYLRIVQYSLEQYYIYNKFDVLTFVSNDDVKEAKKFILSGSNTRIIEVPVGFNFSDDIKTEEKQSYDLIFSGNFNFYPNEEAALFLLEKLLPNLIMLFPNILLCLVGRSPSDKLLNYLSKYPNNLIITKEVKSVQEYLRKAKIYISPLKYGTGMKNKILEAIGAGNILLLSKESTSGLNNYLHYYLITDRDCVENWLEKIRMILENKLSLQDTRINFFNAKEKFSFQSITKLIIQIFNEKVVQEKNNVSG